MKNAGVVARHSTIEEVHATVSTAFSAEEPNSVAQQVRALIWDSCLARAWYTATISQESSDRWYGVNWIFYDSVARWYNISQTLAIRKLVDGCAERNPSEPETKRGVYSLGHIARYLYRHRHVLTRDGLQSVLKVPTPTAADWESHRPVFDGKPGLRTVSSAPFIYDLYQRQFDRMRNHDGPRFGTDTVAASTLLKVIKVLKRIDNHVSPYVNKYVAHAASKTSRRSVTSGPSLRHLHSARMSLCRAYWWIELNFVRHVDVQVLEHSPMDGLVNLNNPVLPEAVHEMAMKEWHKYAARVSGWRRCYVGEELDE